MVSLRATISGFTLSRSVMIFSFPLMKPHFGAADEETHFFFIIMIFPLETVCRWDTTPVNLYNYHQRKTKTLYLSSFSSHHLRFCLSPFPVKSVLQSQIGSFLSASDTTKCRHGATLRHLTIYCVLWCHFHSTTFYSTAIQHSESGIAVFLLLLQPELVYLSWQSNIFHHAVQMKAY